MELTTLLAIFSSVIQTYLIKGIPVPIAETIVSILIISLVNFINLTILTILAFYFKNQIIVMITSLLISMINIMSTLFPPIVVRFLPFSYYTFCLLSRFVRIGTDQEGLAIWSIENIKPEYHLIILVFTIFFIIFLVFRNSIEKREF